MRIQAKCSAMQIQERFAAVDHIHELSLHYSGHKPIKRCTPSPRQWQEAADQEGSSPVGEGVKSISSIAVYLSDRQQLLWSHP